MSAAPIVGLRTPALLIDADAVRTNLTAMIRVIGGAARWRPHVKTAKLGAVMQLMLDAGLTRFKCATTLELQALLALGARDVIVAFPHVGPNAERIIALAREQPGADVAGLVESPAHVASWRGSGLRLFIDLNSGMNRTGGTPDAGRVVALAREIIAAGCTFVIKPSELTPTTTSMLMDVLAEAGVGAAVLAGKAKPDISSVEALKQTLLNARSIGHSRAGQSGIHIAKVITDLGIADAMRDKITIHPAGLVAELLVAGKVELAFQQLSELMAVKGVDIVGPIPDAVQLKTIVAAGVGANTSRRQEARMLIAELASPALDHAKRAAGLLPV